MKNQLSLKQAAYKKIKQKLLWGELPQGTPLRESQLAKELNISRTPVREAIAQLERDGLVVCPSGQSCMVKKFSAEEIHDIYELRELLEFFALRKAINTLSKKQLDTMEKCCRNTKLLSKRLEKAKKHNDFKAIDQENDAVDMNFHLELLLGSSNKYVCKMTADLNIFGIVCLNNMQPKVYSYEELKEALEADYKFHTEFLQAIKNKDIEKACKMSSQHMRAACQEVLKRINVGKEEKCVNWQKQASKTLEILQTI